jgi:hypothetical protein
MLSALCMTAEQIGARMAGGGAGGPGKFQAALAGD